MILIDNFKQVTAQIESERGISKEILISAIGQALISACKKRFPDEAVLESVINPETGEVNIYRKQTVVQNVENEALHISLKEARKIDPKIKLDETLATDVTPSDLGRIAALTAKQVIIQRIREAEKTSIFDEFKDKMGQIITGTIQKVEKSGYLVNLGRTEALLSIKEQIPGERFVLKDKIRMYLVGIEKTPRGPQIKVSRTHPGLIKCLFELEVPEIQDGIITIMSVAREPGNRAKIAVKSNNPSIGAVGACVGHMGGRIQTIINELGKEKIDVLEWNEIPQLFIANALKPSKINQVIITSVEEKTAIVVVPNDQLSLAIGKSGVNVRLAVKLTGWKLDILNEEEFAKKALEIQKKTHVSIIEKIKMDKEKLLGSQALAKKNDEIQEQTGGADVQISKKTALPSRNHKESEITEEDDTTDTLSVSELAEVLGINAETIFQLAKEYHFPVESVESKLSPAQVNSLKEKV